jgi:hypothetical protein
VAENSRWRKPVFSFSSEDVVGTLKKSANINSAIKNFLKRQAAQGGESSARFAKDLRDVLLSKQEAGALTFVDRNVEKFSPHLLAIGAYAHAELVDKVAGKIVTKYADDFNSTYTSNGEEIKVSNQTKFNSIMKNAASEIGADLEESGFADSQFLRAIVLNAIFEPPVLKAGVEEGLL